MLYDKKKFTLALVTGASSGIGATLCHLLADQGIPLIVSGRDEQRLHLLVKELEQKVSVEHMPADLTQPLDRKKLIHKIQTSVPDLCINNAGFGLYGDALSYSTKEQLDILEVNGNAVLELTLSASRTMISKGIKGTIMNISSAIGFTICPSMAVYAASKTFVAHLSQALDFELTPQGIRVLTSCPGVVNTNFRQRAGGATDNQPNSLAMTASFAAKEIWNQIQQEKSLHIFNWKYRLLISLLKFIPKSWGMRILQKQIRKRHPPREVIKDEK